MESLNISLPDPMKRFVDRQIATGRFGSASEYVRELIRNDEKDRAGQQLQAELLEGLSTPEAELTPDEWRAIRQDGLDKLRARQSGR